MKTFAHLVFAGLLVASIVCLAIFPAYHTFYGAVGTALVSSVVLSYTERK